MAKNTKNNLYDIEKENKSKKKNSNKKKVTKKKEEKVSFDNEIIIGVTNVSKEQVSLNTKKKKNKKNNNTKPTKQINKKNVKKKKQANNLIVEKRILDDELFSEQKKEERKAKRKRNIRVTKFAMIIILLIVSILIIMFSPLFNIKEIIVKDNDLISTEQVLSLAGIEKDINIFKINAGKVSKKIKENIYIEEADVSRELPSKVVITIKERKPSFLIEYANGYVTIDKKGYILELNEKKQDLPILQGLETGSDKFSVGNKLENNDINKVYIASKIIDVANSNDMNGTISRIDIENIKDIKLIIESNEKTAYIGDDTNLNIKLLTIKQMMEKTEGLAGEIFVNVDLNSEYPVFRERV